MKCNVFIDLMYVVFELIRSWLGPNLDCGAIISTRLSRSSGADNEIRC